MVRLLDGKYDRIKNENRFMLDLVITVKVNTQLKVNTKGNSDYMVKATQLIVHTMAARSVVQR